MILGCLGLLCVHRLVEIFDGDESQKTDIGKGFFKQELQLHLS